MFPVCAQKNSSNLSLPASLSATMLHYSQQCFIISHTAVQLVNNTSRAFGVEWGFGSVRSWLEVTAHFYPTHPLAWVWLVCELQMKSANIYTSVQPSMKSNRPIAFANSTLSRLTTNGLQNNFCTCYFGKLCYAANTPSVYASNELRAWLTIWNNQSLETLFLLA